MASFRSWNWAVASGFPGFLSGCSLKQAAKKPSGSPAAMPSRRPRECGRSRCGRGGGSARLVSASSSARRWIPLWGGGRDHQVRAESRTANSSASCTACQKRSCPRSGGGVSVEVGRRAGGRMLISSAAGTGDLGRSARHIAGSSSTCRRNAVGGVRSSKDAVAVRGTKVRARQWYVCWFQWIVKSSKT